MVVLETDTLKAVLENVHSILQLKSMFAPASESPGQVFTNVFTSTIVV